MMSALNILIYNFLYCKKHQKEKQINAITYFTSITNSHFYYFYVEFNFISYILLYNVGEIFIVLFMYIEKKIIKMTQCSLRGKL